MSGAKKIMMGGGAVDVPSDDNFNTVGFLSHFDGANNGVNNVFDDGSTSNHTITAAGGVTQGSFSPFSRPDGEWGAYFAGNDSTYMTLPANSLNLGTNNFTLEGWVYTTSTAQQAMVGNLTAQHGYGSYLIILNDSYTTKKVRFYCKYNGGTTLDITEESGTLSVNSWNYIAVTRDGANLRIFINGTQAGSTNTTLGSYTIDPPQGSGNTSLYYVGRTTDADSYSGSRMPFIGYLSNLRVVVGTAVYTSNFTPPTAPLTAISGTVLLALQSNRFVDNSASAHAITLVGSPKVTPFSPLATEVYDPAVNGGSLYNGVNVDGNYLSAADSADWDFGSGSFTVEAWVYATSIGDFNKIVGQWTHNGAVSTNSWTLETVGAKLYFYAVIGGSIAVLAEAGSNFPLNQWVHVAAVRNGNNHTIYQNGVGGTTVSNSGAFDAASGALEVGSFSSLSGGSWDGYIGQVRIVKGTAVYTSNFTPPTAPVTAITNTKLLLNMANAQAFDIAAQNNMTLVGDTKISTTQKKFGVSSAYFDGTDAIWTPPLQNPALLLAGDFTIEGWMWCASGSGGPYGQQTLAGSRGFYESGTGLNWQISRYKTYGVYSQTPSIEFASYSGNASGIYAAFGTGTLTDDAWNHYAVVRTSGVVNVYYNGDRKTIINGTGSGTVNQSNNRVLVDSYNNGISIGSSYTNNAMQRTLTGYIDDFRISNIARYSGSSFDLPTEPYPDKGS